MGAETLRRAAALMRERAEEPVAQPERWPNVVGPALAHLLDREAAMCEEFLIDEDETPDALAVARAYLGETP